MISSLGAKDDPIPLEGLTMDNVVGDLAEKRLAAITLAI